MRNKEEFPSTGCADIRQAKGIKRIFCLVVLSLFCSVFRISAQTSSDVSDDRPRQYLFGDWGRERSSLASKGVTFDFFYVSDLQANPVGGLEQTQAGWGRIRGTMDIDFGKLTDWNGLTFHATGLWQFGGNLGADIGTLTRSEEREAVGCAVAVMTQPECARLPFGSSRQPRADKGPSRFPRLQTG